MKKRRYKLKFPPGLSTGNPTDPFGSYTGVPLAVVDEPEQDADDL